MPGLKRKARLREESVLEDWLSGPRGMMVLFLKQVHLQNVGAAKGAQLAAHNGVIQELLLTS